METERRDEFGGAKRPPLRNRLKACFIRPARVPPFSSQAQRGRGWGVGYGEMGGTVAKPKIEEFRLRFYLENKQEAQN